MTRITDLGRKRTYHAAQFNRYFDNGETVDESAETTNSFDDQSRKRRRKEQNFSRDHNEETEVTQTTGWGRSEAVKGAASEINCQMETYINLMDVANAIASEQRRQKRIQQRMADMTCFACRQKGHSAQNCNKTRSSQSRSKPATGICYRCVIQSHFYLSNLMLLSQVWLFEAYSVQVSETCGWGQSPAVCIMLCLQWKGAFGCYLSEKWKGDLPQWWLL
jgi:zinc finger CCHC domain-containing protein 9